MIGEEIGGVAIGNDIGVGSVGSIGRGREEDSVSLIRKEGILNEIGDEGTFDSVKFLESTGEAAGLDAKI